MWSVYSCLSATRGYKGEVVVKRQKYYEKKVCIFDRGWRVPLLQQRTEEFEMKDQSNKVTVNVFDPITRAGQFKFIHEHAECPEKGNSSERESRV